MIHLTLHCDICLRARVAPGGWWAVYEMAEIRGLASPRTVRMCLIKEIEEKESPSGEGVKACCGVECVTKAMSGYINTVLGERAPNPGRSGR
jgi:hypothetical protein